MAIDYIKNVKEQTNRVVEEKLNVGNGRKILISLRGGGSTMEIDEDTAAGRLAVLMTSTDCTGTPYEADCSFN